MFPDSSCLEYSDSKAFALEGYTADAYLLPRVHKMGERLSSRQTRVRWCHCGFNSIRISSIPKSPETRPNWNVFIPDSSRISKNIPQCKRTFNFRMDFKSQSQKQNEYGQRGNVLV